MALEQTRSHNPANEIDVDSSDRNAPGVMAIAKSTGVEWQDPAYDQSGNMELAPKPGAEDADAQSHVYFYDAWNRLTAVYEDADTDDARPSIYVAGEEGEDFGPDPDDTLIAEYQYDPDNYRIAKLVPNGSNWDRTDYYYNAEWQILEERIALDVIPANKGVVADKAKFQTIWDLRYIDAPVLRDEDKDTSGDNWGICTGANDERLYYTTDANMNVTALVNTSGTVVERYTYDPYGKVTFREADWSLTYGPDQSSSEKGSGLGKGVRSLFLDVTGGRV